MSSQEFLDNLEERLVRLKGGKCVSSDLEVEAADVISKLRAERDELRAVLLEVREWFTPEYECEMLDRIDAALNKGDRDE